MEWRRLLPGLLISVISLAVVFYFADLGAMFAALRLANYRLVLVAGVVTLVWLSVRGLVWRTLLREQATWSQAFWTLNEGYLINNILPFRLGEVARGLLLGRKAGIGFWEVLSTILIERFLDLAFAAGLLLSTLSLVVGADWAWQAAGAAITLVVVGLGGMYLLARYRETAMRWFLRLAARWPALQRFGGSSLDTFFNGLSVITEGRRFLLAVLLMAVSWGLGVVQYTTLLLAFFPDGKLLWAAFSLGVGALGIAAPSSPGAVGVLELALVGALAVFGLDPSTALAFALTVHLLQYVITGVLGAIALARDGETLAGMYRQVRHLPEKEQA